MIAEIVPAFTELSVPIFTGVANDPLPFDNWAVNTFPALAAEFIVNGTDTPAPAQSESGLMADVVILVSTCGLLLLSANASGKE